MTDTDDSGVESMGAPEGSERPNSAWDIVVCGGGPAGFAAALSAARQNAKVLLLERLNQVGGMGVSGVVSHWLGGRSFDTTRWVVHGIFRECAEEAAARGIAVIPRAADFADVKYTPHGQFKVLLAGIPFDPFLMVPLLEEKLLAAGVDILYGVHVVDAVCSDGRVDRVVGASKDGLVEYRGSCFVDATGDADIVARAGGAFDKGDETGYMTGCSMILQLERVDEDALMAYIHAADDPRMRKTLAKLKADGAYPFPEHDSLIFVKMNRAGAFMLNGIVHRNVDGTRAASRTRAMLALRADIPGVVEHLRKHVPGCANVTLRAYASDLGVRETRRIRGEYRLTVADVQAGKEFPDTIGYSAYGWDLGSRDGTQPMHGQHKPEVTSIPYAILVPQGVDNLICAGRCVSVERHVLGPLRVMAPVMAMGEAAGVAASLAARDSKAFRDLDPATVISRLHLPG